MLNLPPHRPKYIMGCDFATGDAYENTIIGIIHEDGVIEILKDENKRNDLRTGDSGT